MSIKKFPNPKIIFNLSKYSDCHVTLYLISSSASSAALTGLNICACSWVSSYQENIYLFCLKKYKTIQYRIEKYLGFQLQLCCFTQINNLIILRTIFCQWTWVKKIYSSIIVIPHKHGAWRHIQPCSINQSINRTMKLFLVFNVKKCHKQQKLVKKCKNKNEYYICFYELILEKIELIFWISSFHLVDVTLMTLFPLDLSRT